MKNSFKISALQHINLHYLENGSHFKKFRHPVRAIKLIFTEFYQEGCWNRSAALAYTTLLTIVPLLTFSFLIITSVPFFKDLNIQVQAFLINNFVPTSAQAIEQYLEQLIHHAAKLSYFGFALLVFASALLVISMEKSFNDIWKIKKHRHSVYAFFLYTLVIILLSILIASGLIATSFFMSLHYWGATFIDKVLLIITPYFATFLAFAFLYSSLPNCKVPRKSAIIGAIVATLLFEFAKYGFAVYIAHFANYSLVYGAFAIIPTFLAWLYISWVVILFGVIVGHVIAEIDKMHDNLPWYKKWFFKNVT